MLDHSARRMAREQSVFRELHARYGAVTQTLFRNESRSELASRGNGKMSGFVSIDHDHAGILRKTFSRKCGK
ncbi:Uncharacterised protein [Mycobacterium tuberculosis]|nr:Uncharacterised protein [Mycobacterium tuberculosis]